jgi:hypothetical protein
MTATRPRIPGHNAVKGGLPRKAGMRVPGADVLQALDDLRRALVSGDHGKTLQARRALDAVLVEDA